MLLDYFSINIIGSERKCAELSSVKFRILNYQYKWCVKNIVLTLKVEEKIKSKLPGAETSTEVDKYKIITFIFKFYFIFHERSQ